MCVLAHTSSSCVSHLFYWLCDKNIYRKWFMMDDQANIHLCKFNSNFACTQWRLHYSEQSAHHCLWHTYGETVGKFMESSFKCHEVIIEVTCVAQSRLNVCCCWSQYIQCLIKKSPSIHQHLWEWDECGLNKYEVLYLSPLWTLVQVPLNVAFVLFYETVCFSGPWFWSKAWLRLFTKLNSGPNTLWGFVITGESN